MSAVFASLLGMIQGLTEFLPVSSSGHLAFTQILTERYFHFDKVPLAFDVFVHLATLLVTLLYLSGDIRFVLSHLFARSTEGAQARRLACLVLVGTLPAAVIGLGFKDVIEESFSSLSAVASGFLLTAVFLELAHRKKTHWSLGEESQEGGFDWELPSFWQALTIGVFQSVAVFPGVSRSGSTIAGALLLGVSGKTAVRFSFFLFLPAVLGAGLLQARNLASLPSSDWGAYGIGFLTTVLFGWIALRWLVRFVREAKLRWFAVYTLLLGVTLHFVSY